MKVTGEFLDEVRLKGKFTGKNILKIVTKRVKIINLNLKNLIGVTTNGALSMIRKNLGL